MTERYIETEREREGQSQTGRQSVYAERHRPVFLVSIIRNTNVNFVQQQREGR